MSWNYRITKQRIVDPLGEIASIYDVREVYYQDHPDGNRTVEGWTANPVTFGGNSPEETIKSLQMALDCAQKHEVLDIGDHESHAEQIKALDQKAEEATMQHDQEQSIAEKTAITVDSPSIEKLHPALAALLPDLHARGISTHVYDDGKRNLLSWLIIERDGNVGTIQSERSRFSDDLKVIFAIKPGQKLGSGLLVDLPGRREPRTTEEILQAAEIAVQSTCTNFATSTPQPNHGWAHFDWAKKQIVQLHPETLDRD